MWWQWWCGVCEMWAVAGGSCVESVEEGGEVVVEVAFVEWVRIVG